MDASSQMPQLGHSPNTSNPSFVDMINILVVDDDATTLAIVSAMLKTWSYQVVAVKSPVHALATLRTQKGVFDLVVTDLHMPQMNGFELHRHIHEEFKLPVIMMSADDKESVILKSLEGGVAYYIVKPVSKDDIKNVWQYAVAAKKGKSVIALEEIESDPKEAPGDIEDGNSETSSNVDQNKRDKKKAESKKKGRKRSRDDDDEEEELLAAPKKAKVVWTNTLHNHFLMAIRHIGLDKAVPKKILEFMKVPGLTRENVASHLQKYRLFLKRVAEKARVSKCLSERVFRSSFAIGHPGLMAYNDVEGGKYSQLFMNQQQPTGVYGIGNALALNSAPSNNVLGSIPFPPQLDSSSNNIAFPQLIGSGQSRLLNNNIQANNTLRQQSMFGNGNLVTQATCPAAPFKMQQVMSNFGNGGMSYGLMNNVAHNIGLTNNIGTNNLMQMFAQSQARQGFTNNPFIFNTIYNPSENMAAGSFNNVNNRMISNMGGGTNIMMNSVFNNNNRGSGFPNGYFDNETMNGMMTGIQNVNLSGAAIGNYNSGYVSRQLGASSSLSSMSASSASLGYETSTTTSSSGYQLASPGSNKIVSVLPKPAEGNTDNSYGGRMMNNHNKDNVPPSPALINNNNNISHEQGRFADNHDDLMLSNLFMDPQNNYQPSSQQNDGDEDEVTPNFSSSFDHFGVAAQPSGNNYQQGVMNQAEDQIPDTAANQVVPNPNSSGSSNVEQNVPTEQSDQSQKQAGDQVLNSEFSSNIFASEDYSILFDPEFPFQDYDDDFMAALLGSGM